MAQTATIPWNAWFSEDETFSLSFPDEWQVSLCPMDDAPALSQQAIRAAFDAPIGTESIKALAQGKTSAAIVIDVMNHYLYENLVDAGQSDIGTPIQLNRYFMESELKVSVSSIIPHEWAGFGGGAKNILPGVAGKDTLIANHKMVESCFQGMTGICEPNKLRSDIEDIAGVIGLNIIVNVVTNTLRETVGVFVGDVVKAHRKGVELARKVCATKLVYDQDVIILNAYPKDTEILQITNALNILHMPKRDIVKKDGIIILASACHEGRGYHAIMGHGTPLCFDPEDTGSMFGGRTALVFSPNLNRHDMKYYLPESTRLFNQWEAVIRYLEKMKTGSLKVGIYPTASLQLPREET